jgi:hypothetical protein
MPTISVFYGIVMFWQDHAPPHFHVVYGEFEATVNITTMDLLRGSLPRRARALVLEWASEHRTELMEDWELCASMQQPKKISPLA